MPGHGNPEDAGYTPLLPVPSAHLSSTHCHHETSQVKSQGLEEPWISHCPSGSQAPYLLNGGLASCLVHVTGLAEDPERRHMRRLYMTDLIDYPCSR